MRQRIWLVITLLGAVLSLVAGYWQLNQVNSIPDSSIIKANPDVKNESAKTIVYYIGGAIVSPGVYSASSGDKIVDAISKAGGFSQAADFSQVDIELNLAQEISANQKILIPMLGQTQSTSKEKTGNQISINSASLEELMELSGVGEVTAQKIINGRPYIDVNELTSKKVISAKLFGQIQSNIVP